MIDPSRLTTREVVERTGVAGRTLRRWQELRIIPRPWRGPRPGSKPGAVGWWSSEVVERIETLRDLRDEGHDLIEAAQIIELERLAATIDEPESPGRAEFVGLVLDAARAVTDDQALLDRLGEELDATKVAYAVGLLGSGACRPVLTYDAASGVRVVPTFLLERDLEARAQAALVVPLRALASARSAEDDAEEADMRKLLEELGQGRPAEGGEATR